MKRILVDNETPETFRLLKYIGKEIKDFRIHEQKAILSPRKREMLMIVFTDGTHMLISPK